MLQELDILKYSGSDTCWFDQNLLFHKQEVQFYATDVHFEIYNTIRSCVF